jgi:dTDP-4-amino-4,6-dideoxygalactose transaminase
VGATLLAVAALTERNIDVDEHFIPLHASTSAGTGAEDFPIAGREFQRVIALRLWPGITSTDIEQVVAALAGILAAARGKGAA